MTPENGSDVDRIPSSVPDFEPLEDIEPMERYCPGGFHPVTVGDKLNSGRYEVVHKLGFGGYSTTWLARDRAHGRYVAIKIGAAQTADDSQESKMLHHLVSVGFCENSVVSQVVDEFAVVGPNGEHRCHVTMPGRMSLTEAKDFSYCRLFKLPVARAIIAHLVRAVDFLHSQGIVHSDLHLGNILFHLPPDIHCMSSDQLYQEYGHPILEAVTRRDGRPLPPGVPTSGVIPIWLGTPSQKVTLFEANIFIADFGESFMPRTTKRYCSRTPRLKAPPESRFYEPLSFSADIWTLACAIFEILGARPLFESFFPPTEDYVTAEQVDALGKLPPEWWEQWSARSLWFDENGIALDRSGMGRAWEERFEYSVQRPRREKNMETIGEDEKEMLFSMLKPMLAFRPRERATARNVLESDWIINWASQDLQKVKDVYET